MEPENKQPEAKNKFCPLCTHADIKCNKEGCAWWCAEREACAVLVIADNIRFLSEDGIKTYKVM